MAYPINLTEREAEILEYISYGLSTEELASTLFISFQTIKSHRRNLMAKIKARNTAHLIRLAFESNLISKNQ
jgi:DNA-binding CsgD family transcriptional regulator